MKTAFTRQTALKSALLLALVANISWEPAMRSLRSTDLATEALVSGSGTAPAASSERPSDHPGPLPTSPHGVTVSQQGIQPAQPARPALAEPREGTMRVCGTALHIRFSERYVDNQLETEAQVMEKVSGPNELGKFAILARGSLRSNLEDVSAKNEIDRVIRETAEKKLQAAGRTCVSDADREKEKEKKKELTEQEKKELEAKVRECRSNDKGEPLSESDSIRCNLKRLGKIEDNSDDERKARRQVQAEIDKIMSPIKRGIRSRLMSRDESVVEEGEEMLAEAIENLEDLSATYNLDPRRSHRMVGELRAMQAGGRTFRTSTELSEEAKELRKEIAETRRQLGFLPDYMMRQYVNLNSRVDSEILHGPMRDLVGYQTLGYVSSQDYGAYTGPYNALRRDLQTMSDSRSPVLGGAPSSLGQTSMFNDPGFDPLNSIRAPSDLLSYRSGGNFRRNYGVSVPQRPPNLTLGNYGTTLSAPNSSPFQSPAPAPLSGSRTSPLGHRF
jgi:hypothetical protein